VERVSVPGAPRGVYLVATPDAEYLCSATALDGSAEALREGYAPAAEREGYCRRLYREGLETGAEWEPTREALSGRWAGTPLAGALYVRPREEV